MPMRNAFKPREIAFALGLGALAAGGAAVTLAAMHDDKHSESPAQRRDYPVAPFDRIAASGSQDVEIIYGSAISVRGEGSARALARYEVTVADGLLSIKPKAAGFGIDWDSSDDATFYVTLPDLKAVSNSGSGRIRIDRVEGRNFAATGSGSGEISIGGLKVDRADFALAGSGDLTAEGSAGDTHLKIAGSGDIEAGDLHSKTASIEAVGSGDVALTVDSAAQVSLTGSGDVDISGDGRCSASRTGSGSVHCDGGGGTGDDD